MQAWRKWLWLAGWFPAVAAAFQPLITDDTGTQGASGNQIESGYFRFVEKEPGSTTAVTALPLVYTRGLNDVVDVFVGGAYTRFSPPAPEVSQSGSGNTLAGLKWRFYEHESDKVSLAFKTEIRFPVSERAEDRGVGSGKTNAGAALLLTSETGFGAIHANLAFNSQRFATAGNRAIHRDGLWRLSVAPVIDLTERWRIAFDTGLITNPHSAEKARMGYLEAGAIYAPGKDIDLAAGIIRDIDHQGHHVQVFTAGVSWRFR